MKFKLILLSCAAVTAFTTLATTASAQDITCNSTYTTERGDSLSALAGRAYGNTRAYQRIFDVNPGKLISPNVVPIGIDLYIPCLNEQTSGPSSLANIEEPSGDDFRVLTGRNYAPYVGDDLPNGGFSTELLNRALQMNDQSADYTIDVVGDWSSHLQTLLANGSYQLAYPWYKPDCSNTIRLSEEPTWRCENLVFSNKPLHEIVVTTYGAADEVKTLSSASDAKGMTICRPAGYFTHDLEAMGLVEPTVTRIAPSTPEDCFEALAANETDLVSLNADTSDRIIREMQMGERVAEVIDFSTIQTLHVVGMRTNPRTRILMRRVDRGLKAIEDQGLMREIAPIHLTAN